MSRRGLGLRRAAGGGGGIDGRKRLVIVRDVELWLEVANIVRVDVVQFDLDSIIPAVDGVTFDVVTSEGKQQ
jgi:hypothetical protein